MKKTTAERLYFADFCKHFVISRMYNNLYYFTYGGNQDEKEL